ncbi:MAG: hypothetical protein WCJ95_23145, partial [Mariniphaga sp.]
MSDFFIHLYRYFHKRRILFYVFFSLLLISIFLLAWQISFDEDISQSISSQDKNDETGYVIRNLKISDKLIIDLTLTDSLAPANPDGLAAFGQKFVDSLNARFDTGY